MSDESGEVGAVLRDISGDENVLLGRIIVALEALGIQPTVDWEAETFEIEDMPGADGIVTGILMRRSAAVVFHRVHSEFMSDESISRLIPAVVRANTAIDVSAVELNETLGVISIRNAVEIGNLDVDRTTLGSLLVAAIFRVTKDAELVLPGLLKVAAEEMTLTEAAATWKPHL